MKTVIVGAGKVGTILAEQLSLEKHDVVVIDTVSENIKHITAMYDVMGLTGNGATVEGENSVSGEFDRLIVYYNKLK